MTTGLGISKAEAKIARCGKFEKIDYTVKGTPEEGHGDTEKTIKQIVRHNKYGQLRKCWE